MKVELPRERKSFGSINPGECFALTGGRSTSVCMKVAWLGRDLIAVLWSDSDDWTVPHLIAPNELAGSSLHSLPGAVFVASSEARDIRAGATRDEHAPGFLIKTPDGHILIAIKGLRLAQGRPVMDVETGKASGIESDNLTFFTSWRIATKVLDKYETVCSFPSENKNGKSVGSPILVADKRGMPTEDAELKKVSSWMRDSDIEKGGRVTSGMSSPERGLAKRAQTWSPR